MKMNSSLRSIIHHQKSANKDDENDKNCLTNSQRITKEIEEREYNKGVETECIDNKASTNCDTTYQYQDVNFNEIPTKPKKKIKIK